MDRSDSSGSVGNKSICTQDTHRRCSGDQKNIFMASVQGQHNLALYIYALYYVVVKSIVCHQACCIMIHIASFDLLGVACITFKYRKILTAKQARMLYALTGIQVQQTWSSSLLWRTTIDSSTTDLP